MGILLIIPAKFLFRVVLVVEIVASKSATLGVEIVASKPATLVLDYILIFVEPIFVSMPIPLTTITSSVDV